MYEWTGGRIREVRKSKGMSLRALARQAELTPTTLSHYETGKTAPPYDVFFRIATALEERDLLWLAGFSDHKENSFEPIDRLLWGSEELMQKQKERLLRWEGKAVSALERTFEQHGAAGDGTLYKDGQRCAYSIPGPPHLRIQIDFQISFQTVKEE